MNKRIIIMGATSGLGRACAEDFISRGYIVGVCGRRTEELEQIRTIDKRRLREHMGRLDDKHILMEVTRDYIINHEIDYYFLHSELTDEERDFFCIAYERIEVDYVYNITHENENVVQRRKRK